MIPLFKTHSSIGKSILKEKDVLAIQEKHNLKEVVVVEDSFYGFRSLNLKLMKRGVKLIFGIQLPVVEESSDELKSKLIFFAKNNQGMREIKKLYSKTYCSDEQALVLNQLQASDFANTRVAVPFYDSFVYQNIFHFGMCNVNLKRFDHVFFEQDNDHPFDGMISQQLKQFTDKTEKVKSIYHTNKEDVKALQFYKAVCGRSGGKPPSFGNPNVEYFCSQEFCWESYLEKTEA
ncbi:hypothetical protein N9955_01015 [bacterium]|nr:hypothetical protein [bacterium]